jgi:hypothetical protein
MGGAEKSPGLETPYVYAQNVTLLGDFSASFALLRKAHSGRNDKNYMKKEYWDVTDEQVIEKTGKPIAEWIQILDAFNAKDKKSNDVVAHLQQAYSVPRYWARTLTTHYLKQHE